MIEKCLRLKQQSSTDCEICSRRRKAVMESVGEWPNHVLTDE